MASRALGGLLIALAAILILTYVYGIVIEPDKVIMGMRLSEILVKYTVLGIVVIIAGILGYLGYLILTSPVPKPVEEFIKEYKESSKVGE